MTLVLDAAALIALDRDERAMWTRMKRAQLSGDIPITHGGVLGQVWRHGARQARLSHALASIQVAPLDQALGRGAGELLGRTGQADVIDAAVVLLALDGDDIITADHDDLRPLAAAAGRHVELIYP